MTANLGPGYAGKPVKVLIVCTGIGRINRGIETFMADAFHGLKATPGLDVSLVIGAGTAGAQQRRALSLHRDSVLARAIGKLVGRDGYTIEQISSLPAILHQIRRIKPDVVFSSEANLAMLLARIRRFVPLPYRYVYSNGAPMPGPFPWADYVHQVTPTYLETATANGEAVERQFLVPYGFSLPDRTPDRSVGKRKAARAKLGLPEDRANILSVGWIARQHKRMDYIIDEVAQLPGPRPFLTMIGAMDEGSAVIEAQARAKLGEDGFVMRSVPPHAVQTYYEAADIFVLGSLNEGFGRVYIEALGLGLPVFSHDYPVARFVSGPEAVYGDFSRPGGLAKCVMANFKLFGDDPEGDQRRWRYATKEFGWPALSQQYLAMFSAVSRAPLR